MATYFGIFQDKDESGKEKNSLYMLDTKDNWTKYRIEASLLSDLKINVLVTALNGQQEMNIFLDLSQN